MFLVLHCKSGLENFDGKLSIFHPSSVQYFGEFIFLFITYRVFHNVLLDYKHL